MNPEQLSDEEKNAATRRFLAFMDKVAAKDGRVRTPVVIGHDEKGQEFGVIVWRKP
jgi:hypothetical protein